MSTAIVKQKGLAAGFSRVLGTATSQFVLLSRDTDGTVGRRIFIDGNLAPKFAALVAADDEDQVMSQLRQLRALAGLGSAYSNVADPAEHMHLFQNMKVTYKVVQFGSGRERPGVYITDVDLADFRKGNRPGVYKVEHRNEKWIVDQDGLECEDRIFTTNAAVNGLCSGLNHAAKLIMPELVLDAYGKRNGTNFIKAEGYSLFYNPHNQISGQKVWRTPEQKAVNSAQAAALLARTLLGAQGRGQKVQWTVFGSGAKIFGDAVRSLQGTPLDCHEAIFLAPTDEADLPVVMQAMRSSGMKLHEEVMMFQADDWSGHMNRTARSLKISQEVKRFGPDYARSADEIRDRGLGSSLQAFNWLLTAGKLPVTAIFKFNSLRNMLAQRMGLTNADVNPHFHPFKDATKFNVHAAHASANKVVFLELVRRIRQR